MISGIPPFQSKSEYMIFKKIEKLEYSFHEGFDENAKDLVKKLLVIEPKERLGMFFFDKSIGYLIGYNREYGPFHTIFEKLNNRLLAKNGIWMISVT